MDNVLEKIDYKFVNIEKSFEVINNNIQSLNNKLDKINKFIDIYNWDGFEKVNKSILLENNYITKTHLFICDKYFDINVKEGSLFLFQFLSNFDNFIDLDIKFRLKFYDIFEKEIDYHIDSTSLKFNHEFTLNFNITSLHFELYMILPYDLDLNIWKYINKILMFNKKINICIFSKK